MKERPVKGMRRNWILAALMLTMALAAMDNTIVATAAVFAVLFNSQLSEQLAHAPSSVRSALPSVDKVMETLQHHHQTSDVSLYLREAFFEGTRDVYVGMVVIGVITILILLWTPAKFPAAEEGR